MNYNKLILILTLRLISNFTDSLNAADCSGKDSFGDHRFLSGNYKINISIPAPQDSFNFLPTESHLLRDICSDSHNQDCALIRALFNQYLTIKSLEQNHKSKTIHLIPYKTAINLLYLKKAENDFDTIGLQASQALNNLIINEYEQQIRNEEKEPGIIDVGIENNIKLSTIEKHKYRIFAELKMFQDNIDFNMPRKKMVYSQ